MESPAGRATLLAVEQLVRGPKEIYPQMNLEIDLGLDSLARAECFVSVEQSLGIELKPEEVSNTQTVGELVQLASAKIGAQPLSVSTTAAPFHWRDVLATPEEAPEVDQLLRPKPGVVLLALVVLRAIYFTARLLFQMEVKGREVLSKLEPPYLICLNHQSYLDPFLVCSTYPQRVLKNIFHVGASMYFTNGATAQLARLINVVPIDPDLQLLHAMRAGVVGLRAGKILNIYPEGQRSFDGQLHDFKKGAAILATELKLPIVPVALDGTYRIWPRKSWRFRLAKVQIRFGEPIDVKTLTSGETNEDAAYQKVTSELKRQIQQLLCESRRSGNDRGIHEAQDNCDSSIEVIGNGQTTSS
jgi:long-chain acyl-CoA synthetase